MKYRGKQLDIHRKRRLLSKIQKANALDKVEEIMSLNGWNSKFNTVIRLRSNHVS